MEIISGMSTDIISIMSDLRCLPNLDCSNYKLLDFYNEWVSVAEEQGVHAMSRSTSEKIYFASNLVIACHEYNEHGASMNDTVKSPNDGIVLFSVDISKASLKDLYNRFNTLKSMKNSIAEGWLMSEIIEVYPEVTREQVDNGQQLILEEIKFRRTKGLRIKKALLEAKIEALKSREEQRTDLEKELAELNKLTVE